MTTPLISRLRGDRRASVSVEFAFVALLFALLMAGTVELGRLMFLAQAIQDAARVAARELSVTPLPAAMSFEDALQQPAVLARVFDPQYLVLDRAALPADPAAFEAYFTTLPLVNRALRPAMIFDNVNIGGVERTLLRYPGALLADASNPTGLTVLIPRVTGRGVDGVETIEWLPVLEEMKPGNPPAPANDPFSVASLGPARGMVAVRINYPFQAGMLTGFQEDAGGPLAPNIDHPIVADDAAVVGPPPPGGATLIPLDPVAGVYAGPYGLGRQLAFAKTVRPYRKLLAGQALFRREVFQ